MAGHQSKMFVILSLLARFTAAEELLSQKSHTYLPRSWGVLQTTHASLGDVAHEVVQVQNDLLSLAKTSEQGANHFKQRKNFWENENTIVEKRIADLRDQDGQIIPDLKGKIARAKIEKQNLKQMIANERKLLEPEKQKQAAASNFLQTSEKKLEEGVDFYQKLLERDGVIAAGAFQKLEKRLTNDKRAVDLLASANKRLNKLAVQTQIKNDEGMARVENVVERVNSDELKMQKAVGENEKIQQRLFEQQEDAAKALGLVLSEKRSMADKQGLCLRAQNLLKNELQKVESQILNVKKEQTKCETVDAAENANLERRLKPFWGV